MLAARFRLAALSARIRATAAAMQDELTEIIFFYDMEGIRLLLALWSLAWGLWVLSPHGEASNSIANSLVQAVAGGAMATIGLLRLFALLLKLRHLGVVSHAAMQTAWGLLFWSSLISSPTSAANIHNGFLTLASAWVWVRFALDHRRRDQLRDTNAD